MRKTLLALACSALWPGMVDADCTADAILVFDASSSMAETSFAAQAVPRIEEARQAMQAVLPEVTALRRVGLVTYGPGAPSACGGVRLHLPPTAQAGVAILSTLESLRPVGGTPLTHAVEVAAQALTRSDPNGTILLVTDGRETCGGTPCTLAAQLAAAHPSLTVHVVGFQVRGTTFGWGGGDPYAEPIERVARCLADDTGGQYFVANDRDALRSVLTRTLACPVFSALWPE